MDKFILESILLYVNVEREEIHAQIGLVTVLCISLKFQVCTSISFKCKCVCVRERPQQRAKQSPAGLPHIGHLRCCSSHTLG
jgi:hypothetical protein